ncbi:HlyD family efflux transporter periplasmic adaptor subunit [Aetokthonos hydrillicola Thurmond2011]|jgi:HlyD family secretion protein|uniref:HlyD family efflux transporter periplasmic adaptor subunit n=1 Tax=Aetokthonos hydrillicola Thurmond2011 TaxID=2712845 RepID=A0AAP5IDE3_9CYAN|nr:HlyD family efflux transporter periplasmic adaptor subunit [Aetokthonos hydrillicola]MBO3459532.1 HlyD family efflux transporter periplasmic adaptor subunit [Aetokthonos hydrillicola CCALA 1050]MBW4590281.1 HlyD family efflux transporter periplasmic adaptor subunit [Aetokthonos hydrillicola CCALA 1050]MDR9899431.1 HlyD family efflux transporter periplasmic adaptor subunit [Aetokthonos hydrillicola Thurmond2011]
MTQLNGNHWNGHYDKFKLDSLLLTDESKTPKVSVHEFDDQISEQSVILRQSPVLSRTIMMTLVGLATFGVGWAYFAKIEQVIPATGQLKPQGAVKEIQAPVAGVVKSVYVKDGQHVKPGELLLVFDSTATKAELDSLNKIRNSLIKEIDVYRNLTKSASTETIEIELLRGNLSREAAFILKSRAALVAENELLRTELKNSTAGGNSLGVDEQERLKIAKKEQDSRVATVQLQIEQSKKKLTQNQVHLSAIRATLVIEKQVLNKLRTLAEQGGISQLQYIQQQKQVQDTIAEISRSWEEQKRLKYEIQQGEQQLKNSIATANKITSEKIADNKKRIAEIDSQLTKNLLENEKKLAETNSKISQAQLNFKYQVVRAPVEGIVFDLQAKNPGFVANASQKILQIVPNENLVAEAEITNKDIGFVKEGMKVDVRVDSFPYSEFGDVKGELILVGSDALPPDQTHQYYRFPAKIRLDKQSLLIGGRNISLQPGMSITANIKVREERTVMSLFTELFTKQVDSLKQVR